MGHLVRPARAGRGDMPGRERVIRASDYAAAIRVKTAADGAQNSGSDRRTNCLAP